MLQTWRVKRQQWEQRVGREAEKVVHVVWCGKWWGAYVSWNGGSVVWQGIRRTMNTVSKGVCVEGHVQATCVRGSVCGRGYKNNEPMAPRQLLKIYSAMP